MAIAPTGDIYKALEFDGESSRSYGVYITGEAVYNAPERDVEMISIPGRNGSYALDKGRFQNIEVTYPAGIFAENEDNFRTAISDFRNYLCSKRGYVRLTDEYNPTEYRMAIYKSGLEVEPALLKAGEFNITFECKPQRWMLSGESAITVTSGDTVLNPTLFDASPMLEVEGYGTIEFNGYTIELENVVLGEIELGSAKTLGYYDNPRYLVNRIAQEQYNTNDVITFRSSTFNFEFHTSLYDNDNAFSSVTSVSDSNGNFSTQFVEFNGSYAIFTTSINAINWYAGTDGALTDTITITIEMRSGTSKTFTVVLSDYYTANIGNNISALGLSITGSGLPANYYVNKYKSYTLGGVVVQSTISALGNPTYIDCDLGAVYMIKNGSAVSLDRYVDLGSELPVLALGVNTITFDNTVTDLQIIPRWWKV